MMMILQFNILMNGIYGLLINNNKINTPTSTSNALTELKAKIDINELAYDLKDRFWEIDLHTKNNLNKILGYFREEKIDESAFHGVNGYGYGDIGREKMDNIIANLFGAESAHVRLQFFSGTHAISTALFASLKPGEKMLCVSGPPYDTLEEVIGIRGSNDGSNDGNEENNVGSLAEWGISYDEIDMINNGQSFDLVKIKLLLDDTDNNNIKLIHVQRSCGYQWRPSIMIEEIEKLVKFIKNDLNRNDITIFVDNCYGELVEELEPCHVGVDLIAGSLIKNLGGTLAPSGGYVAGRKDLVNRCAKHLAAPGVEGGATFKQYKEILQGLFLAPVIVGESLKGAELVSKVFTELGYECNPPPNSKRTDIIQAIKLGSREKLIKFCEITQSKSPVGSHIKPIPGNTSGYDDEVIFADGTFVEGSTLELSADGPLREPYVAFIQGCTHWSHWSLVLETYLDDLE